jgi:hypothetical protein
MTRIFSFVLISSLNIRQVQAKHGKMDHNPAILFPPLNTRIPPDLIFDKELATKPVGNIPDTCHNTAVICSNIHPVCTKSPCRKANMGGNPHIPLGPVTNPQNYYHFFSSPEGLYLITPPDNSSPSENISAI